MTTFFVFDDMATTNNRISLSHFLYLQLGISGLFLREQMLNTTLSTILTFSFTAITEAALKFSLFPSNNKFIGFYRHPLIFVVIAVTIRGTFCCLKQHSLSMGLWFFSRIVINDKTYFCNINHVRKQNSIYYKLFTFYLSA